MSTRKPQRYSKQDLERVMHLLYKHFPQGLVAGGCPRDLMTGAPVKDIDFWLPQTEDLARKIFHFANAVGAGVVSQYDAQAYTMQFDEERISSLYQLAFPVNPTHFISDEIIVDIIEAKVSNAWHVLDTFTDNFSSAVALPVAVDRIQYQWVDGQVPTRLQFRNLNPDNPR